MKNLIKKFVADESGATAIEYGLIAALVATAVIAAFGALDLEGWFEGINNAVTGVGVETGA